jgi:hypothetical protein
VLGNPVLLFISISAPSKMVAHIVQLNDTLPGVGS